MNNLLEFYNYKDFIINNLQINSYILYKNGEHKIKNLVPSCKKCNLSKGTKLVIDWINDDNKTW